ncbi:MAG: hypothetical protein EA353_01065 [Puniceicoccaceae bacterium]|nr:MAG: hypothetical protein EA353_01065 [Puniceicoccaceae bacterium]
MGLALFVLFVAVITLIHEPENAVESIVLTAIFGLFVALTKGILISMPYMAFMEVWFLVSNKREKLKRFEITYSTFLGGLAGMVSTFMWPFSGLSVIFMIPIGLITGLLMAYIYLTLQKAEPVAGINSVTSLRDSTP